MNTKVAANLTVNPFVWMEILTALDIKTLTKTTNIKRTGIDVKNLLENFVHRLFFCSISRRSIDDIKRRLLLKTVNLDILIESSIVFSQ